MAQEVVRFIRKANDLVEAKYRFDIWETRIFSKMLTMIHRDDEDFKEYRIYLRDIVQEFGLVKTRDAYEWLRAGAKNLMKKTFLIPYELDGVKRSFETPVVSSLDSAVLDDKRIRQDHLYISISFHPKMKPYLLQLKSQFTIYDVQNIVKLPSTYSVRIYELLKQYEKIGRRRFQVEELKDILGLENEYPLYANFKQRVIQKAQKDLAAHTDIVFTFDEIKRGRAVMEIVFTIKANLAKKKGTKTANIVPEISEADQSTEAFFQETYPFAEAWVSEEAFRKWMKECDLEHLKRAVHYLRRQLDRGAEIDNPGGYLYRLMQEATLPDLSPKTERAKGKKQEAEQTAARKMAVEEQVHRLRSEYFSKQLDRVGELFIENEAFQKVVFEAARQNLFSGYDETLTPDQNFVQNRQFRASVVNQAIKLNSDSFRAIEDELMPDIKQWEAELRRF
jgi:plasmid replication initiation protein